MGRFIQRGCLPALLVSALLAASTPEYLSARRKIELIRREQAPAGSVVVLDERELNAIVQTEAPQIAKDGVRDAKVTLGNGQATGFAYIDFPKLRQSQGKPMGWLMSRLLAGERPVKVDAKIISSGGRATVELQRVEISGWPISGAALDYLVRNFLWSYFPNAAVNRPFELAHRIDRLEVQPSRVQVVIAGQPQPWRQVTPATAAAPARGR